MNYSQYTIEDLLTDESFINCCEGSNERDIELWQNISREFPELIDKIAEAQKLYLMLAVKCTDEDKQRQLNSLKARIELLETEKINGSESVPVKTHRITWYSIAAAILILIGAFSIFLQKEKSPYRASYEKNFQDFKSLAKTGLNERKKIHLPDGSIILLNSSSTIKISSAYNKSDRVLWLKGEAFFEVSHDKKRPFIVIADETTTTALGTSFKIRNYKEDTECSIMLSTGKVSIEAYSSTEVVNKTILLPGEELNLSKDNGTIIKSTFADSDIKNWTERKLVFSMASMDEIKNKLHEMYGVSIVLDNKPTKRIAFTGEFHNENLLQVLDAIGFSNHFNYSINNNEVHLSFDK